MTVDLRLGDCLDVMRGIPDASVDAVITDPPYGLTPCEWDSVILFSEMWAQIERLSKPSAATVLFGRQPFTSLLVNSNLVRFKYAYVWVKTMGTGFMNAKLRPVNKHEDICVFSRNGHTYNPQMETGKPYTDVRKKKSRAPSSVLRQHIDKTPIYNKGTRYPSTILSFSNGNNHTEHPTQKPLDLMERLVLTYTNGGDTVLDFAMGSGTTGVACVKLNRNFIGIEISEQYFAIAQRRIAEAQAQLSMSLITVNEGLICQS